MNKTEVSQLFKKIKQSYAMFHVPTEIDSLRDMVNEWVEILESVSYADAVINLRRYAADADNKFPPHPGILAKPLESKTNSDLYYEIMKVYGADTLQSLEEMKLKAVTISEEQQRKVRELFGK